MEGKVEKLTVRLPARFVKALDFLVAVDDFPSRSEAIRSAVRDLVYDRIEMVPEKIRRVQEAEAALQEAEALRRDMLRR